MRWCFYLLLGRDLVRSQAVTPTAFVVFFTLVGTRSRAVPQLGHCHILRYPFAYIVVILTINFFLGGGAGDVRAWILEESVASIFRVVGFCTLKTGTAGYSATFLNSSHTTATSCFISVHFYGNHESPNRPYIWRHIRRYWQRRWTKTEEVNKINLQEIRWEAVNSICLT